MRTHAHRFVFGGALAAAVCLLAGPGGAGEQGKVWKQFLPADAYKELLARDAKTAAEALAGQPGEAAIKKAQFNALMIAGYTMSAKGVNAGDLATAQAVALTAAKRAGEKGKTAQARTFLLALLKGTIKAEDERKELTDPKAYVADLADLMEHYKTKNKGGEGIHPALQSNIRLKGTQNGIEEKLRALSMKKLTDANMTKEAHELALLGYRMAVVGELTYFYAPKKNAKEWRDLALDMRNAGVALAEAATKKDAEAVLKASNTLSSSCNQCHSAFRK
jgi:hypothetical protein